MVLFDHFLYWFRATLAFSLYIDPFFTYASTLSMLLPNFRKLIIAKHLRKSVGRGIGDVRSDESVALYCASYYSLYVQSHLSLSTSTSTSTTGKPPSPPPLTESTTPPCLSIVVDLLPGLPGPDDIAPA